MALNLDLEHQSIALHVALPRIMNYIRLFSHLVSACLACFRLPSQLGTFPVLYALQQRSESVFLSFQSLINFKSFPTGKQRLAFRWVSTAEFSSGRVGKMRIPFPTGGKCLFWLVAFWKILNVFVIPARSVGMWKSNMLCPYVSRRYCTYVP
jgi:hypothetical protein